MYVACIGSRSLLAKDITLCETIGRYIASVGSIVVTGNAKGADQAYARGANSVAPTAVRLYLPWRTYNAEAIVEGNKVIKEPEKIWYQIAAKYHPNWGSLKRGGRCLHARNVGIIGVSDFVVAFPSGGYGGGTAMGMRLGHARNLKVDNLREQSVREHWESIVMRSYGVQHS